MNNRTPNVVLNFSTNQSMDNLMDNQPLALMPAALAKKLLKMYQSQLSRASQRTIIDNHIDDLRGAKSLDEAVELSASWFIERELIENVAKENWDAYKVEPKTVAMA